LHARQSAEFSTDAHFVVRSQDAQHPFYAAGYMTACANVASGDLCPGAPAFVNVVSTSQYQSSYVFFTDPTYPETDLVLVRKRNKDGAFAKVNLECANNLSPNWQPDWKPVGSFEYARVDLSTNRFDVVVPGCANGRQAMWSDAPFGVTVW